MPNENAAWSIGYDGNNESVPQASRKDDYTANIVLYDDLIYLKHNRTGCTLSLNDFSRSRKAEGNKYLLYSKVKNYTNYVFFITVHVHKYIASNLRCVKPITSNNKTPYLKAGDTINIKSENNTYTLSSHEVTFTIDDISYQEVDGLREKIGRDDEVLNLYLINLFFLQNINYHFLQWRIDIYRLSI